MSEAPSISLYNKAVKAVASACLSMVVIICFEIISSWDIVFDAEELWQLSVLVLERLNYSSIVLAILYALFLYKMSWEFDRGSKATMVLSVLLAGLLVSGTAVSAVGTINIGSKDDSAIVGVFTFLGIASFFYTIMYPSFRYFASKEKCESPANFRWRKSFWLTFLLLLLAWAPYVIVFSPGSGSPDMQNQLDQYLGYSGYSTHHPLLSTLVYGFLYSVGAFVGSSDASGIFCISIVQTICLAAALSFECCVVEFVSLNRLARLVSTGFFALCPVFGLFCQWCVKDVLFTAAFATFVTMYIYVWAIGAKRPPSLIELGVLAAAAVMVVLLRNNGIYVVLISLALLIVSFSGRCRKLLMACLLVVFVSSSITNHALELSLNADRGSIKEALSVPFQQTARYVLLYSGEVTAQERAAIDAVLDYDALRTLYDPYVSDPVKKTYKEEGSLLDYFHVWLSQGLNHPIAYLDATANNTFGYWCVFPTPLKKCEFPAENYRPNDNWPRFSYNTNVRVLLDNVGEIVKRLPIVGLACQSGTYFWLLLICATYFIFRGDARSLVVLVPCAALWLTCVAGPLNGSMRYIFGIVAMSPLVITSSFYNKYLILRNSERQSEAKEERRESSQLRLGD